MHDNSISERNQRRHTGFVEKLSYRTSTEALSFLKKPHTIAEETSNFHFGIMTQSPSRRRNFSYEPVMFMSESALIALWM